MVNPTTTSSGVFGAEVAALKLNIDFSDAGYLPSAPKFGDLTICGGVTLGQYYPIDGMQVRQILSMANDVLTL